MVTSKVKRNPLTVVPHVKIKDVGTFNFDKLYSEMAIWFDRYHYYWLEKNNSSKTMPDGKEMKFEWTAERRVDDYVKFRIEIELWITKFKEKGDGFASADMEISISSRLEKNYYGKFSERKGTFGNFLREIFEGYLIRDRLLQYEGKIWSETYDLIDNIKDILKHNKRK